MSFSQYLNFKDTCPRCGGIVFHAEKMLSKNSVSLFLIQFSFNSFFNWESIKLKAIVYNFEQKPTSCWWNERFRCVLIILSDNFLFSLSTKSALLALIARSHWIQHHAMMHQMAKYFANYAMAKILDQKVTVMVEAMCLLWWLVNLDNLLTIVFSKQANQSYTSQAL